MRRPDDRSALTRIAASVVAATTACLAVAFATDPPDSTVNPQSGSIEVVDAAWSGAHYYIRHVTNPGGGAPQVVFQVSPGSADDLSPHIAIAGLGDTWVTWWRSNSPGVVIVRKRGFVGAAWSNEFSISNSSEDSRNPVIAHDGTKAWVAYEVSLSGGGGTSIAVACGPDVQPWPTRSLIGTTARTAGVDTKIRAESGKLWVTWVDNSTNVAWTKYDPATQTWSVPQYESYASDSVTAARDRIRTKVLTN